MSFIPLLFGTVGSGLFKLIKSSKGHSSCFKFRGLRSRVESIFALRGHKGPAGQRDVLHKTSFQ